MVETIETQVCRLVAKQLSIPQDVAPGNTLYHDLGIDSFDMIELTTEIEEEFDIFVPDETMVGWKTVADIITFINEYWRNR